MRKPPRRKQDRGWSPRGWWTLWLLVLLAAGGLGAQGEPLDVVVAVDSSGSMVDEIGKVREGLNTLVFLLADAGHDVRLILVSARSTSSVGVCVPAPLGSGTCPADDRPPSYLHVQQSVDSGYALQKILATHDSWGSSLRDGSRRSVIVISDDDSELEASDFVAGLLARDPDFASFQFHAIAASARGAFVAAAPGPCDCLVTDHACEIPSAAQGAEYGRLAEERHGVFFDLCEEDWTPAWPLIARRIDEVIFFEGFERGDASGWSASVPAEARDGASKKPGS